MIDYEVFGDYILEELEKITRATEKVIFYYHKVQRIPDEAYWYTCAIHLFNFYVGCERIFKAVAKEIDRNIPTGEDFHRQLLQQMARPNKHRPVLITQDMRSRLDDYRKFRHLFTNIYAFELDASKLQVLIEKLPETQNLFTSQIQEFYHFLVELNNSIQ